MDLQAERLARSNAESFSDWVLMSDSILSLRYINRHELAGVICHTMALG